MGPGSPSSDTALRRKSEGHVLRRQSSVDIESTVTRRRRRPVILQLRDLFNTTVQSALEWAAGYGEVAGRDEHVLGEKHKPPLVRLRKKWKRGLKSENVQRIICGAILVDSVAVLGECIVDAIIDERKDVPGTWIHCAYAFDELLDMVSFVLLPFFSAEIFALFVCFGSDFFQHPAHIFDLVVVGATFCGELLQPFVGRRLEHSLTLLLRVWRVLRVAHGVFMIMSARQEKLEAQILSLQADIDDLKQNNENVRVWTRTKST